MADVHFDFTQAATRKAIFGTLIPLLADDVTRAKVGVVVGDNSIRAEQHLHDLADVERAIDITVAGGYAKAHAKAIYNIIAKAEAQVHGCPIEETHFHEVGKGLTVREILGICTAIEFLSPDKITATAVQTGSGTVECSHGTLDIPAPATKAILDEYQIPVVEDKLDGELCTPTSAAIIAHYVDMFV